jgi:hypothetical protein
MIVSRRSLLLAHPSQRVMRAAGAAASSEALHRAARKQAGKQHAEMMARLAGKGA